MNIRQEWRMFSLNQKVWISLVAAVALLAAAIDCFSLVEPQTWYVVSKTGTCVNARLLAAEVGHPQLATPYKLGRWEQKNSNGYEGTKTVHLSRGQGVAVEVMNNAPRGNVVYFTKESRCLSGFKYMEENN